MDLLTCELCHVSLPSSNMLLHKVRCGRPSSRNLTSRIRPASAPLSEDSFAQAAGNQRQPSFTRTGSSDVYSSVEPDGKPPAAPSTRPDPAALTYAVPPTAEPRMLNTYNAAHPTTPAAGMSSHVLRCKVDSDVQMMQMLHEVYRWVPGAEQVRPTPAVRAQKELLIANMETMWVTPAAWVFHQIFGMRTTRIAGKRTAERPSPGRTVFAVNPFPYQVPDGTLHWVLWMASPVAEWPDERITAEIAREVDERGGGEFVWYANPKMSMGDPELHHVQCFWRTADAAR